MTQQAPIYSQIWQEEPEENNAFEAKACFCYGYDVYNDILPKASWAEYHYLLFKGEKPTPQQALLLEKLAIALANRGPRDHSVRAAMNGGVGGSTAAASLMAALGVGAGQYGGAREVFHAVNLWHFAGQNLERWQQGIMQLLANKEVDVWLPMEHAAGFDPHSTTCPTPIKQTLAYLASISTQDSALAWLQTQQLALENIAQGSLAMTGIAAAVCVDLGFNAEQAEMLFLLLRLSGAAVHALEQQQLGWKKFPYVGGMIHLEQDAPVFEMPNMEELGL